jgi:adenosine deaminase
MQKFIELHTHLGSLTTPQNLWRIMNTCGINIGIKDYFEFEKVIYNVEKNNHNAYLKKFELVHKIQSNPYAIQECVYLAIEDAYVDHKLEGIEIRFNPMKRNWDGHYNLDSILLNACIGLQRGLQAFPTRAGLIVSTDKQFSLKEDLILLEKAEKYKNLGIIGIDCSGEVKSTKDIRRLKEMYKSVDQTGLGKTVHAGELLSTAYEIEFAIEELGVQRIGHGIQCLNFPNVLKKLEKNNVCLEICPTSNITTGIINSDKELYNMLTIIDKSNIPITLNTDGNVFLQTNPNREYDFVQKLFNDFESKANVDYYFNKWKANSLIHTFLK